MELYEFCKKYNFEIKIKKNLYTEDFTIEENLKRQYEAWLLYKGQEVRYDCGVSNEIPCINKWHEVHQYRGKGDTAEHAIESLYKKIAGCSMSIEHRGFQENTILLELWIGNMPKNISVNGAEK